MQANQFDPDRRVLEKEASRRADEDALASGEVSREALQYANGGQGMFRKSVMVRRGKRCGTIKRDAVE